MPLAPYLLAVARGLTDPNSVQKLVQGYVILKGKSLRMVRTWRAPGHVPLS